MNILCLTIGRKFPFPNLDDCCYSSRRTAVEADMTGRQFVFNV